MFLLRVFANTFAGSSSKDQAKERNIQLSQPNQIRFISRKTGTNTVQALFMRRDKWIIRSRISMPEKRPQGWTVDSAKRKKANEALKDTRIKVSVHRSLRKYKDKDSGKTSTQRGKSESANPGTSSNPTGALDKRNSELNGQGGRISSTLRTVLSWFLLRFSRFNDVIK